ncbi:MAG: hypothetical protein ACRC7S_20125 [Cetobacterium sp.]
MNINNARVSEGIKNLTNFLNVKTLETSYDFETDTISVDIGISHMGIGGLIDLKKRLELELSIIIKKELYDTIGHHVSVIVDIGCC